MDFIYFMFFFPAAASVLATALFSATWRLPAHEPGRYSRFIWWTSVLWSLVTAVGSYSPMDLWHAPPGSQIAAVPRGVGILACYGMEPDYAQEGYPLKRCEFRVPKGGYFDAIWRHRRGLDGLAGKNVGEDDASLIRRQDLGYGWISFCTFAHRDTTNALILRRSGGASSGDYGAHLRILHREGDAWIAGAEEDTSRGTFEDYDTKSRIMTVLGLVAVPGLIIACLFVLAKRSGVRVKQESAVRVALLMLPCIAAIFFVMPLFVMTLPAALANPSPNYAFCPAVLLVAYGYYKLIAYWERRRPVSPS
jgi:hypothetical protein